MAQKKVCQHQIAVAMWIQDIGARKVQVVQEVGSVSQADIVQFLEAHQASAKAHAQQGIIVHLHLYQVAKNIVAMLKFFAQKAVDAHQLHQKGIIQLIYIWKIKQVHKQHEHISCIAPLDHIVQMA